MKGKKVHYGNWLARYKLPWMPKEKTESLKTKDKQVAQQRLRQLIERRDREREGLPVPSHYWGGKVELLSDLVKDYRTHLLALGRTPKHVRDTVNRVKVLCRELNWDTVEGITPVGFEKWRAQAGKSAKTLNEYLSSIQAFIGWLRRNDYTSENPLKGIQKVDGRGKETKNRRAWTDEELKTVWYSNISYKHAIFIAARTGLRRAELQKLLWSDIHLDTENPFLVTRASTTKNKKTEPIPFASDLIIVLREFRAEDWKPENPVLPYKIPRMRIIRKDLEELGLRYKDELGRVLDFHALRHTYITNYAKNKVTGKQLQLLARHSDPKLSANVYTDGSQIDTFEAAKNLPAILPCPELCPELSDSEGLEPSRPVIETLKRAISQAIDLQDLSLAQSLMDMLRPVHKNGCPGWIRTSDQVVNSHLLYH